MSSDFQAIIKATLDTSEISKQISTLQSKLNKAQTLKIKLDLDNNSVNIKALNNLLTNTLSNTGANAGQSFAKSLNSSLNKIHLVNGSIGNVKNMLQGAGFDTKSINSITQDLNKMVLTVSKVKTSQLSNGNIKMNISGVDELGRAVSIVRTFDNETGKVVNTSKAFSQSFSSAAKEVSSSANTLKENINSIKAETLLSKVNDFMSNNKKAAKEYADELIKIQALLVDNNPDSLKEATVRFQKLKTEAKAAGLVTNKFVVSLKNTAKQLLGLTSTVAIIQRAVDVAKKMYQEVYNIDTAMTNLKKVTDETDYSYSNFLSRATKSAKELGRAISGVVIQTSEWAKLGYSLKESEELSKWSSIYANVGEVDDATAVSDMVTAMKAYDLGTSSASRIVDSFNELGNRFAVSAADLGSGLSKSASALSSAGTDMYKTLAMITGGSEITQNATEFGNFLRTASMRIRGMKGELEALGEEVDESVDSISKVQTQILNLTDGKVNIFDNAGEFRDYYDIMKDISAVVNDLTSTERASLYEILFGKMRSNQGAALIQAFQSGQVEKAYEAAVGSDGSAMAEQTKWLDSLEGKTQQLKASWQELSNTVIDSDFMKSLIDFGSTALSFLTKIIDNVGVLNTALAAVGISAFIKNFD